MPSARVTALKAEHVPKHYSKEGYVKPLYLSILRSRIMTKVWKETAGEPTSIRKAKAIAAYLDAVPVLVRPHELIVGFYAEDPSILPLCIEATEPSLVRKMMADGSIRPEEAGEWEEVLAYWEKEGLANRVKSVLTEKEWDLARAELGYMEVLPTQYTSRAQGEYDLVLEYGLQGVRKTLSDKFDKLSAERDASVGGPEVVEICKKMNDLRAMMITIDATIRWARRHGERAREMASQESDPVRKQQLLDIASRCEKVPERPAETFLEAVQSYWFAFMVAHMIEHLSHGTSQRLDQVFWPWFQMDVVDRKTLDRDSALDVMEEFLIKVDELGRPLPLVRRKALQGSNFLATYTIGGTKPEDGSDACNELTMVILDAIADLKMNHPDFKFRWHPQVDPRVYRRALEVIRSGLGQPSIKNEVIAIDTLVNHYGFTIEEARSWAVVGCISPAPTINWGRSRRDAWAIRPAKLLELTLFNGVDPVTKSQIGPQTGDSTQFGTFEELMAAYREQVGWVMRLSARIKSISQHCEDELCKRPFLSTLYRRCHDSCRDVTDTEEKGMPWVNDPGIVDSVDSLIALKALVFEQKKYSMAQVLDALRSNWAGHEEMRQEFLNAPKFGNNDDYADTVARDTYAMLAEEMAKVKDINGGSPMPSGLVVTWMFELANKTGALPNGRRLGDPLADGGISPNAGNDKNGPMAAVLSASKVDHRKQKANIFNQKLTPNCIEGEAGLQKFQDYVTASLGLGLDMIQFNIVDSETLKKAKAHPERYQDLVVRVSGYNARFVELDEFVQDAVIARTQHAL